MPGLTMALVLGLSAAAQAQSDAGTPTAPAPVPVVATATTPLPASMPTPESLPGGRPGSVFLVAAIVNRILWALKKWGKKVLPEKYHPYFPLVAGFLGILYGVLESLSIGTPWVTAILTGLAGSAGAVAWRETVRSGQTMKERSKIKRWGNKTTLVAPGELGDAP